jgi:hypothetical protein
MSARKIAGTGSLSHHHDQVTVDTRDARLTLTPNSVILHKNGMEFRSADPFAPWTEMTVRLRSPADRERVHCNGVVISCSGNKHAGYHVSMIFTGLSRQAQARMVAWSHLR